MNVKNFENNRWLREDQKPEFRHRAAVSMMPSGTVLDIGSGDGFLLSLLKKNGIEGIGLDISEEGVSKATAKGLDTRVFDFGSSPLPFPDGSFDTVVILDVLEHLYDPEFVLKEARRVSKKHVIIGVPNFSSLPARAQTLLGKIPENNQPKKGHIFWFNHQVLLAMCTRAGLQVVETKSNTFFESIPVMSFVTRSLARLMPNMFSLSFVVKTSKL